MQSSVIISSDLWNDSLWIVLESFLSHIQIPQDENIKESILMFLYSLEYILPCPSYRSLYHSFLSIHPLSELFLLPTSLLEWFKNLKIFFYSQLFPLISPVPFYSSTYNNMHEPKFWGNSLWVLLEVFLLSYDTSNSIDSIHMFLYSLQHLIPCPQCRHHYYLFIEKYSFVVRLHEKYKMLLWLYYLKKDIFSKTNPNELFPSFLNYRSNLIITYKL